MKISKKEILFISILILLIPASFILKSVMSNPAEVVLKKYLKSKSWQEKMNYTDLAAYPDLVQKMLKENFENVDLLNGEKYIRFETLEEPSEEFGYYTAIKVITDESQSKDSNRWYFLKKVLNLYKIDYISSLGANQFKFSELRDFKSDQPITKTVIAEFSSNTENEINNRDNKYISFKLNELNTGESITVKISKSEYAARDMYYYLRGGKPQPFLLSVYYSQYLSSYTVAKVFAPNGADPKFDIK